MLRIPTYEQIGSFTGNLYTARKTTLRPVRARLAAPYAARCVHRARENGPTPASSSIYTHIKHEPNRPTHTLTYPIPVIPIQVVHWSVTEQVHFWSHALASLPADDVHVVGRLAVALAATPEPHKPTATKRTTPYIRLRAMLLHYATLRGMFAHPMQRPLSRVPGLLALPVWFPVPKSHQDRDTVGGPKSTWI